MEKQKEKEALSNSGQTSGRNELLFNFEDTER